MLDFALMFGRMEYRKISQRLLQGRIRSVESGNYIQSRIPFGYKSVKDGKRIHLEPDPETAPIVRMMFEMYASRAIGYNAITRKLNDMGIRSTRGHQFFPSTVRTILENHVYIGQTVWGKTKTVTVIENGKKVKRPIQSNDAIVVENTHQAIIEKDVFDRVQAIFADNKRIPRANEGKPLSNPLAGLVHCSQCGKIMQASTCKRGRSLMCNTYACKTIGTPLYVVEREILGILKAWCVDYAEVGQPSNPVNDAHEQALKRQLDTINTRLDKARELVELGAYSPAEYVDQKNKLQDQAKAIEAELNNKPAPVSETIVEILPKINNVLEAYAIAETVEEKTTS